ncbi:rhomboid family intramembrane serine protease [Myxococcus sp. K15C18031901]|uniref:rhomboid family intramembrane serine protease n=1 Tax=Myxococcus dinghuensis TaxID=2906761 RepID=UPI0020A70C2E|nr:rhomboid family intramembrane serine protease [Myxococcus dinghuensis]MCP3097366.1 rhomboid family intramembrane serine protease [Myxococcus dinghuensis]
MVILLPLGVDEATLERRPWVSITIAAVCVLAFFATWVLPSHPEGVSPVELRALVSEVMAHPSLELPRECAERYLTPVGRKLLAERKEARPDKEAPEIDLEAAQERIDARCRHIVEQQERSPLRRFSLVPARGAAQPGWLTHMFLHFGWMHLLGNLLFFYVAGLLLEDAWSRPLFAALFLVGGLVAALAHAALDPHSQTMMAGASGAVAACMGAFSFRFASRKVRMGYFTWILVKPIRGTFALPAWAWGGLWFGSEVLGFLTSGSDNGVAVMAHIGGFVFGFAVAALMKATHLEERYVAPTLASQQGGWVADPRLTEAQAALDRGEWDTARTAFTRLLGENADDPDALLGLARVELEQGRPQPGMARLERALLLLAARESPEALWNTLEGIAPWLPVDKLRPATAWRVAQTMEDAPPTVSFLSEPLHAAAGNGAGAIATRALLRAAELRLAQGVKREVAREYVERAKAQVPVGDAALAERLAEVEAEVARALARQASLEQGISLEDEPPPRHVAPSSPPTTVPPRIIPCRLVSLTEQALTVEAGGGQRRTLGVTEVLAVAVGLVPAPSPDGAPARLTALTDLVVSWGREQQPTVVLRLGVAHLGLSRLYPQQAPREAFGRFVAQLLERSHAAPLPDAPALAEGRYPRFTSEAELTRRFYGPAEA